MGREKNLSLFLTALASLVETAFYRLFRYISGNNAKKMEIKMTVPVTMQRVNFISYVFH